MDEYYCTAHPSIDCDALCDNDPYLNIEFNYTIISVPSDKMLPSLSETKSYVLCYESKDKEIQKAIILAWLSEIDVPEDAFTMVLQEISQCVREMVDGIYKNSKDLSIRVDFSVTRNIKEGNEDEGDVEMEVEEDKDNESRRSTEDYRHGNDYGDSWSSNREEDMGIEDGSIFVLDVASDEDEWEYGWEEGIEMEQDIRFVPAAKSCIEGLKMVTVEEAEKCSICFEDFKVGVCLSCSHMFHKDCIQDWLNVGNSCPLCRFQLPTNSNNTSE
ncbi:unnamed protein product [Lathyrus oleraceus]